MRIGLVVGLWFWSLGSWLSDLSRARLLRPSTNDERAIFIIGKPSHSVKPLWCAPSATITIFFNHIEEFFVPSPGTPSCAANTRVLAPQLRHRLAQDRCRATAAGRTRRVRTAARL